MPATWHQYYNTPAHFITYFGEIYFGRIVECPGYDDRFFIIQNDKTTEFRNLKQEERTLERYQSMCREIRDVRVIKHIEKNQIGKEIEFKQISYSDQIFKRMFVFGAGASAHCIFGKLQDREFRKSNAKPPEGNEIFHHRYVSLISMFPAAKLSAASANSKNEGIENYFEEEWEAYSTYYSPQIANRHINLQFYLSDLFKNISQNVYRTYFESNLYIKFLNKIQRHLAANNKERISLVSFNYDTILDDFIVDIFQEPYKKMSDYINWEERNIMLFKPHGSCNWGWRLRRDRIRDALQTTIASKLYEGKIEPWQIYFNLIGDIGEVIAENSWGHEYSMDKNSRGRFTINKNLIEHITGNVNDVYLPALLLPYRDKDEMIMPYDHFNALTHLGISKIEELYLIGWKGNENLFNRELRKHANMIKKIVIVNPNPEEVKHNLSEYLDLSRYEIEEIKDFETFVFNHLDKYLSSEQL